MTDDQPVAEELDRLNDTIEQLARRVAALEEQVIPARTGYRKWSDL